MSSVSKQTVIKIEIIDIDRFIFGRTNRKRVKIPNRYVAKRISSYPEISLEIVLCRLVQPYSSADCQQDWSMKKDEQYDANKQDGGHATPKPLVTPRLCLIVLGHGATLLPLCRRAKRKWLLWFSLTGVLSC